jgi:hypothetical protein
MLVADLESWLNINNRVGLKFFKFEALYQI